MAIVLALLDLKLSVSIFVHGFPSKVYSYCPAVDAFVAICPSSCSNTHDTSAPCAGYLYR